MSSNLKKVLSKRKAKEIRKLLEKERKKDGESLIALLRNPEKLTIKWDFKK